MEVESYQVRRIPSLSILIILLINKNYSSRNGFWPEYNKVEENLNYNNRFLVQGPHYQHYSDSQRYFSQGAAQQQTYGPPSQQLYQRQPEPLSESVFSDIRDSPLYIQPYDEETTRQQTLTVSPQYLRLPPQIHPNAIQQPAPQSLSQPQIPNVQGLQTQAQTTIPVLVRISDNQALIVPVRAVYALPGFLERLVQRVQGYYSVYNPIESLTVDRPYYVPTTIPPFQPLDTPAGASGVQSVNANLVQANGETSAEIADSASSELDTKINDVKQEEIKDETTTIPEEENDVTTEIEKETSTSKDETTTEKNESSETTTVPPSPTSEDASSPTTASPSATESSPTTVSPTSEIPSTTGKPEEQSEESPVEEGPQSSEDNSASGDLQSAG
ncbi:unnamed protein product, partial [Nesidiocoris tenuis]